MANTLDLRFVRTESAIRSAFMELLAKKSVTSITASALCRRAGISRNAFYLHHDSVAGLYAALVDELVSDVRSECLASADRRRVTGNDDAFSSAVLEAFARHEDLLRALLPADDGSLAKRLAEGVEDSFIEAALRFGEHGSSFGHQLSCAFSAWAAVGFISRWIEETEQPLDDARSQYERLQNNLTQLGAEYLMQR